MRKSSNGGRRSGKSAQPKSGAAAAIAERSKDASVKPKTFGARASMPAAEKPGSMASRILTKVRETASGVAAKVTGKGTKTTATKTGGGPKAKP